MRWKMRNWTTRLAFAAVALLACVLFARADVTPEYELGNHASDAAALTYIQANHWDASGDGTGTAREGQCYYNTTSDLRRCYDGAAWNEVDANSTHVTGNGADHANVALSDTHRTGDGSDHADVASNTALAHTQGTDQGLDTGGASAVTAAEAKAAHTHISSDGTGHAAVNTMAGSGAQAVGTGDSPTLDGGNFAGVDADDVDLVTVPSGNCAGETEADGCLAAFDAFTGGGGGDGLYRVDFTGTTYDYYVEGGGTDPVTGFVYGGSGFGDWDPPPGGTDVFQRTSSGFTFSRTNDSGGLENHLVKLELSADYALCGEGQFAVLVTFDDTNLSNNDDTYIYFGLTDDNEGGAGNEATYVFLTGGGLVRNLIVRDGGYYFQSNTWTLEGQAHSVLFTRDTYGAYTLAVTPGGTWNEVARNAESWCRNIAFDSNFILRTYILAGDTAEFDVSLITINAPHD